jgi:pyridoxine 4-dehydrogenase
MRTATGGTSAVPSHLARGVCTGPGTANQIIREALYPYPDGLAIVSKVAARPGGPGDLRRGIEDNLATLGTRRR